MTLIRYTLTITLFSFLLIDCGGSSGGGGQQTSSSTTQEETHNVNPLFPRAWHLDSQIKEDYNVTSAWNEGITGEGVVVAVVDTGIEISHEDLKDNMLNGFSYNYITNSNDPTPTTRNTDPGVYHGTAVAGIIASEDNQKGSLGVAPKAKLIGLDVLEGFTSTTNLLRASLGITSDGNESRFPAIDISNNSWSPVSAPGSLTFQSGPWQLMIDRGITEGRSGQGIIYLFAAGNDGPYSNANNNGFANYRNVIAIGGVDSTGRHPSYSQTGANVLVSGLTQGWNDSLETGAGPGIVTATLNGGGSKSVDNSKNYIADFNGTSAATPGVSGVVALILQANPTLNWRQVRWILAYTARKNDAFNAGWEPSALGPDYNPAYGYGVPDATAAVRMAAENPPELGPLKSCRLTTSSPVGSTLSSVPTLFQFDGSICTIEKIEFVEIQTSFNTSHFDQFALKLTSPGHYGSVLADIHICSSSSACNYGTSRYPGGFSWTFGSVRHMNETPSGTWVAKAYDYADNPDGKINALTVVIWGY